MRSDVIEESEVVGEWAAGVCDGEIAGAEVPELDPGGVVVALDAAVPLGPSGRQDVQGLFARLAGVLELGLELAAAVDLDGAEREGHVSHHLVEEAGGVWRAVARLKTRETMNREMGQTARNSLRVWPSRLTVMWSIWTSSPMREAREPYFQRCAQEPSKSRRRFARTRPRQTAQGRTRPSATPRARIRPTVEAPRGRPSRASRTRSGSPAHERMALAQPPDRPLVLARPRPGADAVRAARLRRQPRQAPVAEPRLPAIVRCPRPADRAQRDGLRAALSPQFVERPPAGEGVPELPPGVVSSTLKLRQDLIRMDSMFMVQVPRVCKHQGYLNPRAGPPARGTAERCGALAVSSRFAAAPLRCAPFG